MDSDLRSVSCLRSLDDSEFEKLGGLFYKIVAALMGEVCARLRQTNDRFVNSVYWASQSK